MNKLLAGLAVLLGVALVGAVVVVGLAVNRPVNVTVNAPLGATGDTYTNKLDVIDGAFIQADLDSDDDALSTSNALLTNTQICSNTLIDLAYATGTQGVTLPSQPLLSQSGQCFDREGATRTVFLRNASSSGGSAINIIAGASSTIYNINLLTATSSGAAAGISKGTSTIADGQIGKLTGIRGNTSSSVWIHWVLEIFRN